MAKTTKTTTKTVTKTTVTNEDFFSKEIGGMSRSDIISRCVMMNITIPSLEGVGHHYTIQELYNGYLSVSTLQNMVRAYAKKMRLHNVVNTEGLSDRMSAALSVATRKDELDLLVFRAEVVSDAVLLAKERMQEKIAAEKLEKEIAEKKAAILAAKAREEKAKTSEELEAELALLEAKKA